MGIDPREMAAAPKANKGNKPATVPAVEKVNPFLAHFPLDRIRFELNIEGPGKQWSDGTVPQTLANAILELGETESFVTARIQLLKTPGRKPRFEALFPSSGGANMRYPMLRTEKSSQARKTFDGFRTLVVDKWLSERREAVANGADTISTQINSTGVTVEDDSMIADLGIGDLPTTPRRQPNKTNDTPTA